MNVLPVGLYIFWLSVCNEEEVKSQPIPLSCRLKASSSFYNNKPMGWLIRLYIYAKL